MSGDEGSFKLYQGSGSSGEPEVIEKVTFTGVQPEALIVYPGETTRVQLLSDDGGEQGGEKN